jgi:predicted amidophosphoribosyltransferase
LDGVQRGRNVKGAFAVPGAYAPLVLDRRVLLVDDVMTSGATASECAHALKMGGAAHVDVLTFALVSDAA